MPGSDMPLCAGGGVCKAPGRQNCAYVVSLFSQCVPWCTGVGADVVTTTAEARGFSDGGRRWRQCFYRKTLVIGSIS